MNPIQETYPDLTPEEQQVLLNIRKRKEELLQEIYQLKEELSDILTEEFSQRLFGVFSRITNATASQAKNELKSEIKEELIEELTTELIFESDQSSKVYFFLSLLNTRYVLPPD